MSSAWIDENVSFIVDKEPNAKTRAIVSFFGDPKTRLSQIGGPPTGFNSPKIPNKMKDSTLLIKFHKRVSNVFRKSKD